MMRKILSFSKHAFVDPLIYVVPFLQITPEVARILDTLLYYLFIAALGVIGAGYIAILEFTEGASKAYKILLTCIIVVSLSMFAASFYDFRITNIFLPLLISLIAMSATSRAIRLYRGLKVEELTVNRWVWRTMIAIMVSVVVVSMGAAFNSLMRGGSETMHYLVESLRKQERIARRQEATIRKTAVESQQANYKADSTLLALNRVLFNQTLVLGSLSQATGENARLKRQLAATTKTVNTTAKTIDSVKREQKETQQQVQVVEMKVDTVKRAVETALPVDTTAKRDTAREIPQPATEPRKRGLWPFRRKL